MYSIDFVIPWVDGSDPAWIETRNRYLENKEDGSPVRFRDWDNLQYWFRGVEKFAPWVNKIYFITWGHLPKWLNTNNPKLKVVKHEDYIPKEWLPTFSSHPIELNLHRIEGLSEYFVYFNDDMFIINEMKETDFFKNGLPCDSGIWNVHHSCRDKTSTITDNDMAVINDYFSKKEAIKRHFGKYFNFKYGRDNIRSGVLLAWPYWTGFLECHFPNSFLKSTLEEVWSKEPKLLSETSSHKFRNNMDVNQWLFRYWQLASGRFMPRSKKIAKYFPITEDNTAIVDAITKQKYKMICINDVAELNDFEYQRDIIKQAFDKILPEKSSFEI